MSINKEELRYKEHNWCPWTTALARASVNMMDLAITAEKNGGKSSIDKFSHCQYFLGLVLMQTRDSQIIFYLIWNIVYSVHTIMYALREQ